MVTQFNSTGPENSGPLGQSRSARRKTMITLSLETDILEELKTDALKERTSLSTLVTATLSKHVLLNRFAKDVDGIFITNNTFKAIVDDIEENSLEDDFTRNALDFIPTIFYSKNIPFTLQNLIKYALSSAAIDGGIYNHFHHYVDEAGLVNLVMRHNFGLKWSRILGNGHVKLIENMLNLKSTLTALPSSVVIKVNTNSANKIQAHSES